jgi:hypothetical protein
MALKDNVWYINYGDGSTTGYYAVTKWAATTTKVCGALIRQNTAPSVGNERIFVCIASTGGTGQTGGSEPAWTVTRGAKNTDNTVTWQEATGVAALNGDLTNCPQWSDVKNTSVTLGQVIRDAASSKIMICTTAGTAGNGAEPSFAAFTNAGATTADNTVTWTTIGTSFSAWSAPHARLANAFVTNWGQAGNDFYVGDNHAETQATNMVISTPGTAASPCRVICVNHSGSVPPVSADLLTTASISTTTSGSITLNGSGYAYWYGFIFNSGSGNNNVASVCGGNGLSYFKSCSFRIATTNSYAKWQVYNAANPNADVPPAIWDNCTYQVGATAQKLQIYGPLIWKNTPNAILGATLPTTLISAASYGGYAIVLDGVDLSALGSGKTIFGIGSASSICYLNNCKLGASVTIATTPTFIGHKCFLASSDSVGVDYRQEIYDYLGTLTTETTKIKTSGASDGTGISWKVVTTANARWQQPFECFTISAWNSTVGSPVTVTVEIMNDGTTLNTDDIWLDIQYMNASGNPGAAGATSNKADILATGTALPTSSATWTTTGIGSPVKQYLSVTFTPQMAGFIRGVVRVRKASKTIYIDPVLQGLS